MSAPSWERWTSSQHPPPLHMKHPYGPAMWLMISWHCLLSVLRNASNTWYLKVTLTHLHLKRFIIVHYVVFLCFGEKTETCWLCYLIERGTCLVNIFGQQWMYTNLINLLYCRCWVITCLLLSEKIWALSIHQVHLTSTRCIKKTALKTMKEAEEIYWTDGSSASIIQEEKQSKTPTWDLWF